jgi:putative endonuclease
MKKNGVYILRSLKNERFYIGSTDNIERRFKDHISGRVLSTKNIRPLVLESFLECESLRQARGFEYKLKKYKRKDIINKVITDNNFP